MNNPDHISESLETIFWVKIMKYFDADPDPGSGIFLLLYVELETTLTCSDNFALSQLLNSSQKTLTKVVGFAENYPS